MIYAQEIWLEFDKEQIEDNEEEQGEKQTVEKE